jgi:hypothetical protein
MSESRFLIILSGCDTESLKAVGERMLKMVARATIEWWGEELSVAVVMGCSNAIPGDTVESLLQRTQHELERDRFERYEGAAGIHVLPSSC